MLPARAILACPLLCAGLSLCTGAARAEVYKCAGEGSSPIYQESPCPPGKELRNFQVDPPQITVLPAPALTVPPRASANSPKESTRAKDSSPTLKTANAKGDAAERKHIRAGMSESEVIARLGPPDVTSGGKNRKGDRWSYLPAPGDPDTITSLTFANGKVTGVERKLYRK